MTTAALDPDAEADLVVPPTRKPPKRGSHRVVVPLLDYKLSRLAMAPEDVARLRRSEREARVEQLVTEAHYLLDWTVNTYVTGRPDTPKRDRREVAGIVGLFSGGNDSTTVMHLFRDRLTAAAHANTGVGIEETRQYVRDTCATWGLPLLERSAPRYEDSYRAHVLEYGFPGPGAHYKMFQRLKLRALEQVQRELVLRPYRERVVFVAGRRRTESQRRAAVPSNERIRSAVWASPIVNWTKLDLNTYRQTRGDVPRNEVSDRAHMSGECLCGCYAHHREREELSQWYPLAFAEIAELEALLADRTDLPPWRKVWGWSGDPELLKASNATTTPKRVGALCEACDAPGGELLAAR